MMTRRSLLGRSAAGGLSLLSIPTGCAWFPAESGDAYAPWELTDDGPPELRAIRAAILAASPHNTQPWRFEVSPEEIRLFEVPERSLGAMDPLGRERKIGLGCALENLVIAARHHGRAAEVELLPGGDPLLVARIRLSPAAAIDDPLYHAIPERHTSRGAYLDGPAPVGLAEALRGQIQAPSVSLALLTAPEDKARFREGTIAATEAIVADAEMNAASDAWYRHSAADIERERDGVTLDATGNDALTRFFGKAGGRPSAETAGAYWIQGTRDRQTTASAFGILSTTDRASPIQQLEVGRAYQRIHLFATNEGLAMQPLNQMAERHDREASLGLEPVHTARLSALLKEESRAQMLFRVGTAWEPAKRSPRRPLAWVVS